MISRSIRFCLAFATLLAAGGAGTAWAETLN
jgi:hypothetical protein